MPEDFLPWSKSTEEVLNFVSATNKGLTCEEAQKRILKYGKNELANSERTNLLNRLVSKLINPLILILLFAGGISAFMGHTSDAIIIIAMIVLSAVIDVIQEHKAESGAEKLKKRVSLTATTTRDGKEQEIPMSQIVPGDIITLTVGDIVPADCRLISLDYLLVNQSVLTGESYPAHKQIDKIIPSDAAITERTNMVFMGTDIIAGEGKAVVVDIGSNTEYGKIAKDLVSKRPQTEFEQGVTGFGFLLLKTAVFLSTIVFLMHIGLGHDTFSSLLFVMAVAVGFAPELLPLILTINLSKGAIRMAHKGVIVKHLPAIENFGSMDILATDKTGTLTENEISVQGYYDSRNNSEIKVLQYAYLSSASQHGYKGPMEEAIIKRKHEVPSPGYHAIATLPFDHFRKRSSVVTEHKGRNYLITKGAPEDVLDVCHKYEVEGNTHNLTSQVRKRLSQQFQLYGKDGLRTLSVAYKEVKENNEYSIEAEEDLIFLGFITFSDPPKNSAGLAIKGLIENGVSIRILTGDSEQVTEKVCKELDLPVTGILTGNSIAKYTDQQLIHAVSHVTIFARLNPELKVRVIMALKHGHAVGYLGDGINDAPSLRAADIGISVNNATDVAKDAADIILLHKDLHVLMDGVKEGRKTFANVMKYLMMGLSSSFGNMVSVIAASLFLPFLPMLPAQILFLDFLYDVAQLFLASDSVDESAILKPRRWDFSFLQKFMLIMGPVSSIFDLLTFALLLRVLNATPEMFRTGWFVESLVTQTIIIFSIRTAMVPFFKSKPNPIFALSLLSVIIIGLVFPFTQFAPLFGFVKLPFSYYLLLAGIVIVYLIMVEGMKLVFYRSLKKK